jgi:hypothetical protein
MAGGAKSRGRRESGKPAAGHDRIRQNGSICLSACSRMAAQRGRDRQEADRRVRPSGSGRWN